MRLCPCRCRIRTPIYGVDSAAVWPGRIVVLASAPSGVLAVALHRQGDGLVLEQRTRGESLLEPTRLLWPTRVSRRLDSCLSKFET